MIRSDESGSRRPFDYAGCARAMRKVRALEQREREKAAREFIAEARLLERCGGDMKMLLGTVLIAGEQLDTAEFRKKLSTGELPNPKASPGPSRLFGQRACRSRWRKT